MDPVALPEGEEKTRAVRAMFDAIAPRYELVNRVMTFGLDASWRRRTISDLRLPAGSLVLDVAAGTGDLSRELARQGQRAVAADLSYGMLDAGHGVDDLVQADVAALPFADGCFDGVTCGYGLRNFTDLAGAFAEMARVTRPGGRLSLLEVAEPRAGALRRLFRVWFRRVVPVIGAALSDAAAYRYLPRSTAYLPDADEVAAMLRRAGFAAVNHWALMGGLSQQFVATRAA